MQWVQMRRGLAVPRPRPGRGMHHHHQRHSFPHRPRDITSTFRMRGTIVRPQVSYCHK
ncbi:UNVERIFIED_CONTAM: hypothetical protein Sangu_2613100 [Sesamum angustifolium]|uniref:Uncharacterized protein n=1 Tax=Sesamum angustifolium TaxID=2727405 RepID=A0AAW2J511_9LAMI